MLNNHYKDYWKIANQCEREIIRICHEYELKHNISDTSFWILYILNDSDADMTQTDICNAMYAPRQSANTALKKMEQDGIVEKISVPGNLKSKYIVLTTKGSDLAAQVIAPMKQAEHDTFASFTDEAIGIYLKITQKRCVLFREQLIENR